ncbi:CynX/NimT family MFS transporter [Silvibacterium sp.]|uniref:MFS transporter n=1 Tax=Silvibacterium sp. TaxID=1964179 RepID=UPI0039E6D7C4
MAEVFRSTSRGLTIASYLLAIALTQFFNYFFAPLLPLLAQRYHVTLDTAAWTVLVFPLSSAVISGTAGALGDRIGFFRSIQAGLAAIALFALLRVYSGTIGLLIVCQLGIGLSVPFVLAPVSSFLAAHCNEKERDRFTGLCTVCLFAGIGLSFFIAPWLVQHVNYTGAMDTLAILAIAVFAFFTFSGAAGSSIAPDLTIPHSVPGFRILGNRNVVLLCLGGFLGQGCFNAIVTWIVAIWQEHGLSPQAAGLATSIAIFSGIAGSLILPPALDRFLGMRRGFFFCVLPAACLVYPCLFPDSPLLGFVACALIGFFQFPTLAMAFNLLARSVPIERTSSAVGIYWMTSNLGIFSISYTAGLIHHLAGWHAAASSIFLCLACLLVTIPFLRDPQQGAPVSTTCNGAA